MIVKSCGRETVGLFCEKDGDPIVVMHEDSFIDLADLRTVWLTQNAQRLLKDGVQFRLEEE